VHFVSAAATAKKKPVRSNWVSGTRFLVAAYFSITVKFMFLI
jgi:hypothetical protein